MTDGGIVQRQPRHDQIAFYRQRYLASFMLMIDAYILILSAAIGYAARWRPFTPDRFILTVALVAVTVLCLLLAAGTFGGVRDMWAGGMTPGPVVWEHRDTDFFATRRMIFFYAGVNLNIITLSVLIEQTGGIITSPYSAVFFAFVLTGQQLSRFKTQSSFLISVGVILTLAMWIYETSFGILKSPSAPKPLVFLLVVSTFIACGLMTNYEKNHNYYVEGNQNLPTHAHVYRDAEGVWHFEIYCQRHRIDPIVGGDVSSLRARTGESSDAVRRRLEATVKSMYEAAGWGHPKFLWPEDAQSHDQIVRFPVNEAGVDMGDSS